jgi:hypothetical protein
MGFCFSHFNFLVKNDISNSFEAITTLAILHLHLFDFGIRIADFGLGLILFQDPKSKIQNY